MPAAYSTKAPWRNVSVPDTLSGGAVFNSCRGHYFKEHKAGTVFNTILMEKEKRRKTGMYLFLLASTLAAILAYTTGFWLIAGGVLAAGLLIWGIILGSASSQE